MATLQEQLDEVQAAISAVMTNQEVSFDGKTIKRADLAQLEAREKTLLRRIAAERRGGRWAVGRGGYRGS